MNAQTRKKIEEYLFVAIVAAAAKGYKVGSHWLGLEIRGDVYAQIEGHTSCILALGVIGKETAEDYIGYSVMHMADVRVNNDLERLIGVAVGSRFWNGVMSGWDDHAEGKWHPGTKYRRNHADNLAGYRMGHRLGKRFAATPFAT